jgi:hypothetical protein
VQVSRVQGVHAVQYGGRDQRVREPQHEVLVHGEGLCLEAITQRVVQPVLPPLAVVHQAGSSSQHRQRRRTGHRQQPGQQQGVGGQPSEAPRQRRNRAAAISCQRSRADPRAGQRDREQRVPLCQVVDLRQ